MSEVGELNPREKYDLLWELSRAAMLFGIESQKLSSKPTIEDQEKAFRWWRETLAKAQQRLDVVDE